MTARDLLAHLDTDAAGRLPAASDAILVGVLIEWAPDGDERMEWEALTPPR